MSRPVLIFPGGMTLSLEFLQRCLQEGRPVVGASSLGHDPARPSYPCWEQLPFVTDPEFDTALVSVLESHGIGELFTPSIVVWNYLRERLPTIATDVTLANVSPVDEALGSYRSALAKARLYLEDCQPLDTGVSSRPSPSETELASLIRYTDSIPGMCDDFKLRGLLEMARHTVRGDIVEIGSWWGKSAFILSRLARLADIGNLLCVDPWANEHLKQGEDAVDSGSAKVDAGEALKVFEIGLASFNQGHINYLRLPSVEAAKVYHEGVTVTTETFGSTRYEGRISILHVDGNHAYEAAKADVDAWSGRLLPGGWLIVDDYLWPYGDGPRRVGDEFLAANQQRISHAFVTGSALFIRLAGGHSPQSPGGGPAV